MSISLEFGGVSKVHNLYIGTHLAVKLITAVMLNPTYEAQR